MTSSLVRKVIGEFRGGAIKRAAQYIHENSKKRAKKKNLAYELSPAIIEDMFEANAFCCTVTNVGFDFSPVRNGERRPWFPSLDRIDSDKGYTKDNCRIVCVAANAAMNVWGEKALRKMAEGMLEQE